MTNIKVHKIFILRNIMLILLTFQIVFCKGQLKVNEVNYKPFVIIQNTTFPQIHTNLNGMVREFVRTMYQDKKGNFWFGTNGSGIIRYDGQKLEKISIAGIHRNTRILKIKEDKEGLLWFGTSDGLIKYDGEKFSIFSKKDGLPGDDEEIWGLTIDKNGLIWVGTMSGVSHFDGKKFTPFFLPDTLVQNPNPILSTKRISGFLEDTAGNMWINNDGNGIFKYKSGIFKHLTTDNGLTDNNAGVALQDKKGNLWISSYFGGVSKFDGTNFINYTKDGIVEGIETSSFFEDSNGNIWFTAENVGVYKYDGSKFTLYTTKNGLTTNGIQCIFEDNKGQMWFTTWQGMCIFDGEKFVNANLKEPWTN